MRRVLIALVVLVLLAGAAAGGAYLHFERAATVPIAPGSTEKVVFEVPKGATVHRVGELLAKDGFIASTTTWRVHTRLHRPPSPKAGRHELTRGMNMPELLAALAENPLPEDVPLTVVEGWRLRDLDAHLVSTGWATPGAFIAAASALDEVNLPFAPPPTGNLEGYLYPETYMVPKQPPLDLRALVQRQLDAFQARFAQPYADEIAKSGRTLHELVTMASLLEREEPKPEVRPKVAGVLWKRYDAKTPLGVDATSRYTIDEWNDRKAFLKQLRDPSDVYNTRLKTGLPPGPIGAPALPSLLAALRPEASEYWYYLHDSTQTIRFAKDGAEHEANRKKYDVY